MTTDEAADIIARMKAGMGFGDEDPLQSEAWFYTYTREKDCFRYLTCWTVIGSVTADRDLSEEDFRKVLLEDFGHAEVLSISFQQDGFA